MNNAAANITTRWAFINAGDLVIRNGEIAEVASIEFDLSSAWRTVTLTDGSTLDIKGSWKVERVNG
jgi:hypothetical protein